MAAPLIVDHPGLRIWRASDALMKLLPSEKAAPRHTPRFEGSSINAVNRDGISYITCSNGRWHVDGYDMLTFVVVRGSLKLQISYMTGDERQGYDGEDAKRLPVEAEHQLARGDVVVLWGLYAHRAIGKGDMTMVNVDCAIPLKKWLQLEEHFTKSLQVRSDIGKVPLYSPRFTERILISHLRYPISHPEGKKPLWTKYSSVLNGR